jgi:hypothetical protein
LSRAANIERRKNRRIPLEGNIKVRVIAPGPPVGGITAFSIAEGHLYDVTTVGAFVATSLVLERGQRVELEIAAPGMTSPKRLVAVVARCTGRTKGSNDAMPPGLGVLFVARTEEERTRIREMVMATLTLDLLDYGYDRQLAPTPSEAIPPPDGEKEPSEDNVLVDTLLEGIRLDDTDLATALWHLD